MKGKKEIEFEERIEEKELKASEKDGWIERKKEQGKIVGKEVMY